MSAGCSSVPEAAEAQAAVDGEDGRSWHLPLPPLNATSLPEPYTPGGLLHAPLLDPNVHGQYITSSWQHAPLAMSEGGCQGYHTLDWHLKAGCCVWARQVCQQPFDMGEKQSIAS